MEIPECRPGVIALRAEFILIVLSTLLTTMMGVTRPARAAEGPAVLFVADKQHGAPEHIRTWNDWLEAGFEIEVVKDHLGHCNIQSTLIYAQITDKHRIQAFERIENSSEIVKL